MSSATPHMDKGFQFKSKLAAVAFARHNASVGGGMQHYTNELIFDRPDWLIDRTYHMFAATAQGQSPFNIVLSRTSIEDETLDQLADRIVRDLAAALDNFIVGPRQAVTIADRPALILQSQWTQNGLPLYQRQAMLVREGPGGRVLHQITGTASEDARQHHLAAFGDLLASLRFRNEMDGRLD